MRDGDGTGGTVGVGVDGVGTRRRAAVPTHVASAGATTVPELTGRATYRRRFEYAYEGTSLSSTFEIPRALYWFYRRRVHNRNYGAYVSDDYGDRFVAHVARSVCRKAEREGFSPEEVVDHLLAFLHDMPYVRDVVGTGYSEYPKYPVETLVDRGGDCEDTCILAAAVLGYLGYDVRLLALREAAHMALGVNLAHASGTYYVDDGKRFYYAETTGDDWRVGEVPALRSYAAELLHVDAHPVLVHHWTASPRPTGGARVDGAVRNVGRAVADEVRVAVAFEDESGRVVAENATTVHDTAPGMVQQWTVPVGIPDDVPVRGRVRLHVDGRLHDQSTSSWQHPQRG